MIFYEIEKVIKQRGIRVMLPLLFLFSVFYFSMQIFSTEVGDDFLPGAYIRMYHELDTENLSKQIEILEKKLNDMLYKGEIQEVVYANSLLSEYHLYQTVIAELEQIDGYASYVKGILSDCQRYTSVSFFKSSAAAVKNAQITYADFEKMTDTNVSAAPTRGIYLLFRTDWTELLVLFAILLIISVLVSSEVEENTICLLRCSTKGRARTAYIKYMAGVALMLAGCFFLFIIKALIVFASYGIPDFTLSIQSVYGCSGCVIRAGIGQMLLLFFGLKSLSYIVLYSVSFLAALFFKRFWQLCMAGAVFFGACWIACEQIEAASYLAWMKWLNPVAMLYAERLLFSYRNLVLGEFTVNYLQLMIALGVLLILVCLLVTGPRFCLLQNRSRNVGEGIFYRIERIAAAVTGGTSLSGAELRKWSFYQNGILLCFAVLTVILLAEVSISQQLCTKEEIYYRYYVQEVQGEYSDEKLNTLYRHEEELEQLNRELSQHEQDYPDAVLNYYRNELEKMDGLHLAIAYGEYLREKPKSSFIYEQGYKVLFGLEQGRFPVFIYRCIALIVTVLLAGFLAGIEQTTGMERLIRISGKGTGLVYRAKYQNILLIGILVSLIVYLPWFGNVFRTFGMEGIYAPAYSMKMFSSVPRYISLLGMIILFYIGHLLYLWLMGFVMVWSCRKIHSLPAAVIGTMGIGLFSIILLR